MKILKYGHYLKENEIPKIDKDESNMADDIDTDVADGQKFIAKKFLDFLKIKKKKKSIKEPLSNIEPMNFKDPNVSVDYTDDPAKFIYEPIGPVEPVEPVEPEVRQPTPIEIGDWVEIFDFETLNKKQIEYLKSQPFFYVKNVTDKNGEVYDVGVPHIDVGYRIPLKMSRFKKVERPETKYKVLFLQFDLAIDMHGEKDKGNFFRGFKNMSELFPILFHDKLKDDVFVSFNSYDDIYRTKNDYYVNGICLKDFDFVFFGHISNFTSICKMVVGYLKRNDIPYLKYGTYNEYDNKAFEFDLLENLGYPYIPSIMTSKLTQKIINIIENDFGFPVIVKDVTANRGTGVFKVDNLKSLIKTFSSRYSSKLMLIQKMIPNDGDFRVITIKNKVQLVIKKQRIDEKEFRSNVARGGKAIRATLPTHIINMCEDISKHLDSDIVGFDIIQNIETKEYFVMEANAASHFPTFSVISGVDIPLVIVNYIIKKIKK